MALNDFEDEDPYRSKVLEELNPIVPGDRLPKPATPVAPAAPAGGYDLEKFRKAWYGQGDVNNIQGWLDQNKAFTSGVTLKNEKAYDPSGRFIADLVGNYSGAPTSQRTAIFLDGIGSNGKRPLAPTKSIVSKPVSPGPKTGGPLTVPPSGLSGTQTGGGLLTQPAGPPPPSGLSGMQTGGGLLVPEAPRPAVPPPVAPPRPAVPPPPVAPPPSGASTFGGAFAKMAANVAKAAPPQPSPVAPPPVAPQPQSNTAVAPPTMPPEPVPQAPVAPAANDFLTQMRQMVTDRLGKMGGDPSIKDPALAGQSEAYRRARERGAQQQRASEAERAAANGTLMGGQSSGSFDASIGGIAEASAEDVASNDASLVGQEVQARRAELQNLLGMATQSGDAESSRALQMQMAQLDAQLRREGLGESARQFDSGLSENQRQFGSNFGENQRQYDNSFGENQRQFGSNFGENQRQYDNSFGENQRQYNSNFGEDQRQYNTNFGEGQRQFNSSLGENRRQFDGSLGENKRQFNATDKYRYKTLDEQRRQFDDEFGRNIGRDYESDYWKRVVLGLEG